MEAAERVAKYRSGQRIAEIWGSRGRDGFRDDLEEIADYFIRQSGLVL